MKLCNFYVLFTLLSQLPLLLSWLQSPIIGGVNELHTKSVSSVQPTQTPNTKPIPTQTKLFRAIVTVIATVQLVFLPLVMPISPAVADPIPAIGSVAPDFTLPSNFGKDITLQDFVGKTTVLYFYPVSDMSALSCAVCFLLPFSSTGAR